MVMSLFYLFISFILLHAYVIGEPFESILSILITFYLLACAWALPYILNEMGKVIEAALKSPVGFLLWNGIYIIFYFTAPFIYLNLKFFSKDTDSKE